MCVGVWPYEALQYSCIKISLISSCLIYLLADKTNHPAFYLAAIVFSVRGGRWWWGLGVLAWGFCGTQISFLFFFSL